MAISLFRVDNKQAMKTIRKIMMLVAFGERCTCGLDDRCYICSPEFRFWEYYRAHV